MALPAAALRCRSGRDSHTGARHVHRRTHVYLHLARFRFRSQL